MGPEGGGRRAPSSTNRSRTTSRTGRRRRGARRPRFLGSAAVLTILAAAIALVGGQLGAWDGILRSETVADRTALPGDDRGEPAAPEQALGPVIWAGGQDPAARDERLVRYGRPIPPSDLTGYRWPLEGAVLTNGYGANRAGSFTVDGRRFHDGIDLATACGDPVVAAHDGTVLAAGRDYDSHIGWLGDLATYRERLDVEDLWDDLAITVVVDDGNGYRSIYAHFKSVSVTAGQRVSAGDLLGYEGRTGDATGCHLHYALFSPHETASIRLVRRVAERSHLPARAIARIDPLLVLPDLEAGDISLPR
jgi:murein DD-endopeptidase MepM/ murein hydrolase activator NlpD